jgi:hypothetical protein
MLGRSTESVKSTHPIISVQKEKSLFFLFTPRCMNFRDSVTVVVLLNVARELSSLTKNQKVMQTIEINLFYP